MTKYILVGGHIRSAKDQGQAFFEKIVEGFEENQRVKILYC